MKAKEFIPASKPRNFVAKNQKTAGAGAHRDKKKEQKQGYEKHKNKDVAEVSKATIDRYVTKASDAHGDADFKARMSKDDPTKRSYHKDQKQTAEKRRQGISRALDRMSREESIEEYGDTARGQKMLTKVQKRAVDRVVSKKADTDPAYAKKNKDTADRAWDRMTDKDESIEMERVRDPEDWDEGNTEPPNNFAVYINGKKWKIFRGRGTYADDYREQQHYQQLKAWADKKSQATGKKWTVHVTGEPATESVEEGWKEKLAGAALAGTMALGAGGANARVIPGADPDVNRLTGKPNVTQVQQADDEKQSSSEQKIGFSSEYLKKVANGEHPRPMISKEDAKKELERRGER